MRLSRFLWNAHPLRAVGEAVAVELALLAFMLTSTSQAVLVGFTFGTTGGLIGVVICAFRARLPEGPLLAVLVREAALAGALTGASVSVALLLAGQPLLEYARDAGLPPVSLLLAMGTGLAFFPLRLIMQVWRIWNVTRRRRLLWSIVHAHLLTVLALLVVLIIYAGLGQINQQATGNVPFREQPISILTAVMLTVFSWIVAVPFVAGIMALAGIISYFTARPITHRIEALARLTGSLRAGSYGARIAVEGEDEIAQLQADFNAMAADLERTLSALKTERDTVAGLLQTRRELLASVSHELRTPVAILRSYLETALANWRAAPPSSLRHDLEVMEGEIIRLQALIDDLFALSRAEVGRLTLRCAPTDVDALIRRVVETSAPLAQRTGRVQVIADLTPQLPRALADAARLEQVLRNLIHNSVRHTPPGGIVALAASAESDSPFIRIDVRDTGEGISPGDLPHIWERFYRGSQADGYDPGAGIGLALVKEFTVAMGGTVAVESAPGQGSCFTVRLPTEETTSP